MIKRKQSLKGMLAKVLMGVFTVMSILPNCTKMVKAEPIKEDNPGNKRIVAYFPEWGVYSAHNGYAISNVPWDKITHLNYAFATIKNGKVAIFDEWAATGIGFNEAWDSPYKGNYGQIKKFKEKHPNTRVLISVGGWSQSAGFHDAAATPENRKKFADSAVEFIKTWGFDGVDIDWEYPTFKREGDKVDNPNDQGTPKADDTEKETFTLLLKDLRAALTEAGKKDNKYYELTAAVGCGKDKIEKTEPDKYAQYLDFINVMTYDMRGAWETKTGHQSPLYKNPQDPSEGVVKEYYNVDTAMKLFESYGISKSKLIVGSPFYSRGWTGVKNDGPVKDLPGLFATATGGAKGIWDGGRAAGCNPFYYLKDKLEKDSSFKKYRDPLSKVPYLYSESKGEMYTYEDEESLTEKINYVNKENYGGIIFWELSGDYPSKGTTLTDIIYNGFKGSIKPPVYETAPLAATLNNTTVSLEGNYKVNVNIPINHNADKMKLVENYKDASGKITTTVQLEKDLDKVSSSVATKDFSFRLPGTYTYTAELSNKYGVTTGTSLVIEVKDSGLVPPVGGVKYPSISSDNLNNMGDYSISIAIPENNKADTVTLYENDKAIYSEAVDGKVAKPINKSFTNVADGSYKYRAELTNKDGGKAIGATITVKVNRAVEVAKEKPATPSLSQNSWNGESNFTLTMNVYWGNNGVKARLFENGKVIEEKVLQDKSPAAQIVLFNVNNRAKGTYKYYVELSNSKGASVSPEITVTVSK